MILPRVSPNVLSGLMETIAANPYSGRADLPHLAANLQMEVDDLFWSPRLFSSSDLPKSRRATSVSPMPEGDLCRQRWKSAKGYSRSTC